MCASSVMLPPDALVSARLFYLGRSLTEVYMPGNRIVASVAVRRLAGIRTALLRQPRPGMTAG